jgi:hypothetical protein
MRVMAPLKSYLDPGWQLHAVHELINPFCSHTAELDVAALAKRLGGDSNLVENRGWFVARLRCTRCTRCGLKGDIRCSPPTNSPNEWAPIGAEARAPDWK